MILTEYERYLRASGWSPDTVRLRMNMGMRCWEAFGLDIDRADVETVLSQDTRRGRPPSMWTQATYFSCIKSWCKFLIMAGYITEDPTEDMPRPRGSKDLPRPLTDAQVERVKAAASGKLLDWILIMLATGMRVHEVAKLRGEDVQPDYIHVVGKGRKTASIPTHDVVWSMASRYPATGYWFPGGDDGHVGAQHITTEMTALFKSLGIDGSSHRLRHTFATRMLRDGQNLRVVQRAMRHESLATTQIYTEVVDDELVSAVTGMRI
jgi:site-specific recombinase XerD